MSHSNFEENLISLSKSNNIENAKEEWRFAFYNIRDDRRGKCICNKTHLKHVYLYRNKITGEWIECGKGCMKKHNLWKPPSNKKGGILKTIKYINRRVGWSQPYTKFNHNEYIKNVVVSFKKDSENSDYEKLLELLNMFDFVISESATFDNEQILNFRNDINKKLFEMQKKREEKERKIKEEQTERELSQAVEKVRNEYDEKTGERLMFTFTSSGKTYPLPMRLEYKKHRRMKKMKECFDKWMEVREESLGVWETFEEKRRCSRKNN